MKKFFKRDTLIILTVVVFLGVGAYAFAYWGMGPGMMGGWGNYGPGWHHGVWNSYGYGPMSGNLGGDELAQINGERSEFFAATESLRQDLYAKQLELRNELAKENPDSKRAANLQNDISNLQTRVVDNILHGILSTGYST
ncbi:MAG: periplasmic heavy metal sensor, partial [Desulfobacterales bacterium]